jgi:hypothetical protein
MANRYNLVNATGSGGSGDATPFTLTFNAAVDWGAASGGFYSIAIPQSTHDKSIEPLVQLYELVSGDYEQVDAEIVISIAGDVTIKVTDNIDARFAGKVVIL